MYYEGTKEREYGTFAWLVPGTVTEEARKEYDAYTEVVFVEDRLSEVGGLHAAILYFRRIRSSIPKEWAYGLFQVK